MWQARKIGAFRSGARACGRTALAPADPSRCGRAAGPQTGSAEPRQADRLAPALACAADLPHASNPRSSHSGASQSLRSFPGVARCRQAAAGFRLDCPCSIMLAPAISIPECERARQGAAMSEQQQLAMLERRRIEAAILKHVYDALKASHGKDVAQRTLASAVRASAMAQAREMAERVNGATSMQTFIDRQELWTRGGALERDVLEQNDSRYRFHVTRCKYAEMYRDMGLGEIGHLLSCQRDGTFCEGYDRRLKLKRTQTIMQGASHCDFDYSYEMDAKA